MSWWRFVANALVQVVAAAVGALIGKKQDVQHDHRHQHDHRWLQQQQQQQQQEPRPPSANDDAMSNVVVMRTGLCSRAVAAPVRAPVRRPMRFSSAAQRARIGANDVLSGGNEAGCDFLALLPIAGDFVEGVVATGRGQQQRADRASARVIGGGIGAAVGWFIPLPIAGPMIGAFLGRTIADAFQ